MAGFSRLPGCGSDGRALSRDFGRNPLGDLGSRARVDEDVVFRLAEQIHEARRDDEAAGIDSADGVSLTRLRQEADGRDLVAGNGDIAAKCGRARAVDDEASLENEIIPLLPHGRARAGEIARRLGVSQSTLTRRLSLEGLTFSDVLESLRCNLAERYLTDGDLSISQISWLLGYQEVSTFTHAFKRWTGKTPREARSTGCAVTQGAPPD